MEEVFSSYRRSYEWSNNRRESPKHRQYALHKETRRGIGSFPQDRMSTYGGSLATARTRSQSPKTYAKWLSFHGKSKRANEAALEIRERAVEAAGENQVLQQLSQLRSEAQEVMIAEGNSSKGYLLLSLQKAEGQNTPSQIILGERLLAEVRYPNTNCQKLLDQGAHVLFRDWAGNLPLHLVCTHRHAHTLLQANPEMVGAMNFAQQSPLIAIILRYKAMQQHIDQQAIDMFSAILAVFREVCGISPFFIFCRSVQSTPYGLLSTSERAALYSHIIWEDVQGTLLSNADTLLRRLRQLWSDRLPYPAQAADGAMHFFLFEEVDGDRQHLRLQQIWHSIRTLLRTAAGGNCNEGSRSPIADDCARMARWLLHISGFKVSSMHDPRGSYRAEFALCLAELQSIIATSLDHAYHSIVLRRSALLPYSDEPQSLVQLHDAYWLQSTPPMDEMIENRVVASDSPMLPILRSQLRSVCESPRSSRQSPRDPPEPLPSVFELAEEPAWLRTQDLDDAIQDLRSLGAVVSTIRLVNVVADANCSNSEGRVVTAFAWLHAVRLCRLHEIALGDMKRALEKVLFTRSGDLSTAQVKFPQNARSLDDVWSDAQNFWEVCGVAQDRPADFVCDITHASAVYKDIASLRTCYNMCENLDWNRDGMVLVRTANGFHRANVDPRGHYRSCVVWLVINTHVGPLVAQLDLHLETFHEKREVAMLLADCIDGKFEQQVLRKPWCQLVRALSELSSAIGVSSEHRLQRALQTVKETLTCEEIAHLQSDLTLQEFIAAAEKTHAALISEYRNLRDGTDIYETRLDFSHQKASWLMDVADNEIARWKERIR